MNSEVESERPETTQTSLNTRDQATSADTAPRHIRPNSRDVAHQYEPLSVSPAEQAFDTGVIR
jgi:hypothetical protein